MKNRFLILFILILGYVQAQDATSVNNKILKVNLLTPGLSFEKKVFNQATFVVESSISIGFVSNLNESKILSNSSWVTRKYSVISNDCFNIILSFRYR